MRHFVEEFGFCFVRLFWLGEVCFFDSGAIFTPQSTLSRDIIATKLTGCTTGCTQCTTISDVYLFGEGTLQDCGISEKILICDYSQFLN